MNLFIVPLVFCYLFAIIFADDSHKCAQSNLTKSIETEINKFRKLVDARSADLINDDKLLKRTLDYSETVVKSLKENQVIIIPAPPTPAPNVYDNFNVYFSFSKPDQADTVLDVWKKQKPVFDLDSKEVLYQLSSWGSLAQLVWKETKFIACTECLAETAANKSISVVICGFNPAGAGIGQKDLPSAQSAFKENVPKTFPVDSNKTNQTNHNGTTPAGTTVSPTKPPSTNGLPVYLIVLLALFIILAILVVVVIILACISLVKNASDD